MEETACANRKRREFAPKTEVTPLPLRTSNGGTIVVGENLRVDPSGFRDLSIVSGTEDIEHLTADERFLIPQSFRPQLANIKKLLQPGPLQAALAIKNRGFSLIPLDGSGCGDQGQRFETRPDCDFRVLGFIKAHPARAAESLCKADRGSIENIQWISPEVFYPLLNRRARRRIRKLPGSLCLSCSDYLTRQGPIVGSQRLERSAAVLLKVFLRQGAHAALVRGEAGSGKSCLLSYLAQKFTHMTVPARLQGWLVVRIGIEPFMSTLTLGFAAEEAQNARMRAMMAAEKIIWVIDEASRLVDRDTTAALDNLLLFIDQGASVVLISDQSHLLEKRAALARRLNPVFLREAESGEVLQIVAALANHQGKTAGVTVSDEALQAVVRQSGISPYVQPHAATHLLGNAIAECEVRGRTRLTAAEIGHEDRSLFSQGDILPEPPGSIVAFIRMMRKHGFRGHSAFLKHFGRRLLGALRRRYRAERQGAAWGCLVVGNSGHGKSMLLGIVAKMIAGCDSKVKVIRCSSYQQRHAIQSLIGSPKSYIGYGEGGELIKFIKEHPDGAILFEEPELGHPSLMDLVHEMLDGSLSDGEGNMTVHTRGITILIASNTGCRSTGINPGFGGNIVEQKAVRIKARLADTFPPALLSRIGTGNVFFMEPLNRQALRNILRLKIQAYSREERICVRVDDGLVHALVDSQNTDMFGARAVLDRFRDQLEPLLDSALIEAGRRNISRLYLHQTPAGIPWCETVYPGSESILQSEAHDRYVNGQDR